MEKHPIDEPYLVCYFIKKPKILQSEFRSLKFVDNSGIQEIKDVPIIRNKVKRERKMKGFKTIDVKHEIHEVEIYNTYAPLSLNIDGEFHFLEELPETNIIVANFEAINTKLIKEKPKGELNESLVILGARNNDHHELGFEEIILEAKMRNLIEFPYMYFDKKCECSCHNKIMAKVTNDKATIELRKIDVSTQTMVLSKDVDTSSNTSDVMYDSGVEYDSEEFLDFG